MVFTYLPLKFALLTEASAFDFCLIPHIVRRSFASSHAKTDLQLEANSMIARIVVSVNRKIGGSYFLGAEMLAGRP